MLNSEEMFFPFCYLPLWLELNPHECLKKYFKTKTLNQDFQHQGHLMPHKIHNPVYHTHPNTLTLTLAKSYAKTILNFCMYQ